MSVPMDPSGQEQYSSSGGPQYGLDPYGPPDDYVVAQWQPTQPLPTTNPYPVAGPSPIAAPPKQPTQWLIALLALASLVIGFLIGNVTAGGSPASGPKATVTVTATPASSQTQIPYTQAPSPTPAPPQTQGPPDETTSVPATEESTSAPASTNPPGAAGGDGKWEVGKDIQPGTYTTVVPANEYDLSCYVAALASADEQDIIDNDLASPGEQVRFTIPADAAYFETVRCGTWQRA